MANMLGPPTLLLLLLSADPAYAADVVEEKKLSNYARVGAAALDLATAKDPLARAQQIYETEPATRDAALDMDLDEVLDSAQETLYGPDMTNVTSERECVRVKIPGNSREGTGLFTLRRGEWAFRFKGSIKNGDVPAEHKCSTPLDARGLSDCLVNTNGHRAVPLLSVYDATRCIFPPGSGIPSGFQDDINAVHARCGQPFFGRDEVSDVETRPGNVVQGFWRVPAARRVLRMADHRWQSNQGEIIADFCRPKTKTKPIVSDTLRNEAVKQGSATLQAGLGVPGALFKKAIGQAVDYTADAAQAAVFDRERSDQPTTVRDMAQSALARATRNDLPATDPKPS